VSFLIRPWHINDLDSLVKHANNWNVAQFTSDNFPHPYTKEHGKKFIELATSSKPIHIFAIDINGEAIGGIGIHPQQGIYRKNAELGYWLSEDYWGKGIISEAVKKIVLKAFKLFDIERLFASTFGTNIASQRVLEKAGFTLDYKLKNVLFKNNTIHDDWVYSIRRENLPK
jgi:[ribosomal protein S5]-alanine N-acetyltransferase